MTWQEKFERAHGFPPPFTPDELPGKPPWCETCCDFHEPDDEHSYDLRHPDAYEYGEPWGPDNPAPGSAWDTRKRQERNAES